jgi:hypothetical protein
MSDEPMMSEVRRTALKAALEQERPRVKAVGRHVSLLVLPETQRSELIEVVERRGRAKRALVMSCGERVRDIYAGMFVEFDPYKLIMVHGTAGWRGASSEVGLPGDLALIHERDVLVEIVSR